MDQSKPTVFTDDRVASAVLDVIRNAERYVVLVSPYNQFWDHLRDDLRLAVRRNVQVTLIYREDQPATDIDWVGSLGVTVYGVGRLHAKIFMNESVLLVTSMNLLETSSKNSKEIAIQINDEVTRNEIREYVKNRLVGLGEKVYPKPSNAKQITATTQNAKASPLSTKSRTKLTSTRKSEVKTQQTVASKLWNVVRSALTGGVCIRCERSIEYDPFRPLCDNCFRSWNRYQDPDYEEMVCHKCGRDWETSYAKPLCRPCYDAGF